MHIDWFLAVDLLKAWAWPLVALFAAFLLRKPLAVLVAQIAKRARKFSVYEISVELATVPELSSTWTAGSADVRQLTSAHVFDSASTSLFNELLLPGLADYAVVDLGKGKKWLTSRLFIFALVLGRVRGLRAFVFVETSRVTRKRFLGIATPSEVHRALGAHYPWLEEAQQKAAAAQYNTPTSDVALASRFSDLPPILGSEQYRISPFVNAFVSNIQRTSAPPPAQSSSHLEIGTSPQTWERTNWIDGERLERDLSDCLSYSFCEEQLDEPARVSANAIIRRSGDFVAIVDKDRKFLRLVDRRAVLESVAREAPVTNERGDAVA